MISKKDNENVVVSGKGRLLLEFLSFGCYFPTGEVFNTVRTCNCTIQILCSLCKQNVSKKVMYALENHAQQPVQPFKVIKPMGSLGHLNK